MSLLSDFQTKQSAIYEATIISDAILGRKATLPSSLLMYYYGNSFTDKSGNNKNGALTSPYTLDYTGITFNGGYGRSGSMTTARGTWELYCMVNADFTPANYSAWYDCSCLVGCELSETHQDFGMIINKNGYISIGYSTSSISASSIKINDGKYHHCVLTVTDTTMKLYVDGTLVKTVSYSNSGTIPSYDGIFWNYAKTSSIVKGRLEVYRYYSTALDADTIKSLYEQTKEGLR